LPSTALCPEPFARWAAGVADTALSWNAPEGGPNVLSLSPRAPVISVATTTIAGRINETLHDGHHDFGVKRICMGQNPD